MSTPRGQIIGFSKECKQLVSCSTCSCGDCVQDSFLSLCVTGFAAAGSAAGAGMIGAPVALTVAATTIGLPLVAGTAVFLSNFSPYGLENESHPCGVACTHVSAAVGINSLATATGAYILGIASPEIGSAAGVAAVAGAVGSATVLGGCTALILCCACLSECNCTSESYYDGDGCFPSTGDFSLSCTLLRPRTPTPCFEREDVRVVLLPNPPSFYGTAENFNRAVASAVQGGQVMTVPEFVGDQNINAVYQLLEDGGEPAPKVGSGVPVMK